MQGKRENNYYYWLLNVEHLHNARDNSGHLCMLTCLMLTTTLRGPYYYHPPAVEEEIEAQIDWLNCPGPPRQ